MTIPSTTRIRPRQRPNIVFVFSDEHRWCSQPFTEMPQLVAPNMVQLAQEGLRLDNCCSTAPICVPYRGMLITGMWPHQSSCVSNDFFSNGNIIGQDAPTIAHTFAQAGYATSYIGKWHLKEETAINAGFDLFQHWLYGDDHWDTLVREEGTGTDWQSSKGYNAIGMTDQALDFIARHADGERPFMMMLSLNPPHWRWDDAPEEFLQLYPQETLPFRDNVTDPKYKEGLHRLHLQHYHAHVTAVDVQLGRIMTTLRERGIADNTILIYTSDHGTSFGSNNVHSKGNPFDESVRVPFTIRWPGHVPANRVADANIGTMDLYPTLCGLAGIVPPAHCGGIDFSPIMLGRPGPDPATQFLAINNFQRNFYIQHVDPTGGATNTFAPFRAVRSKRHTFVANAHGDWLLFDNQADPYQMRNLVDDPAYTTIKNNLRRELESWLAKAEDPFIPASWRGLSLAERIATQNQHWSMVPFYPEWEVFCATTLAPWLEKSSPDQASKLRAASEQIFDEAFFGRYKALTVETQAVHEMGHFAAGGRGVRLSQRPMADIRTELQHHTTQAIARFELQARLILGQSN
ncbi:MAG: sulfatase [Planctomycetota bacterium]